MIKIMKPVVIARLSHPETDAESSGVSTIVSNKTTGY